MSGDRTDLVTWVAAAAASAGLAILLMQAPPAGRSPSPVPGEGNRARLQAEVEAIKGILGHYPPGEADRTGIEQLLAAEPGNSRAQFHLGDIYYTGGRLGDAAASFRRALELNRGYADPRAPEYQGERLRGFVEEGLRVYLRERDLRAGDESVRGTVRDLYFIRRALAGGCD